MASPAGLGRLATPTLAFAAAVALYLPTTRFGFAGDDYRIVHGNPAAHSISAALRAVDDPYWPRPSRSGAYRPLTILSFAVDWMLSGGRPAWLHFMNTVWHGLAAALVVVLLGRWLPPGAALAAGLLFAAHPVHVEPVAAIFGRADLLVGVGLLGAVVAARRRRWLLTTGCAAAAMWSKEVGVIAIVLVLVDDWLQPREDRRYPPALYVALGALTLGFVWLWYGIGGEATAEPAPAFFGTGTGVRLSVALTAMWRAATLLVWPSHLSTDYGPQVIPVRAGASLAAFGGLVVTVAVPLVAWWSRRRAPALAFAAVAAAASYSPTSNLLFPSGVVLAERHLYLAVLVPAAAVGYGAHLLARHWGRRAATVPLALVCLGLAARSLARLPVWRDNKSLLLVLVVDHPESFRGHWWASEVFATMGDTAAARRELARADSLFPGYPHFDAWRAGYLLAVHDTVGVAALLDRVRRVERYYPPAVRAQLLLALERRRPGEARALADSAAGWFPWDTAWYREQLR
ncbi:MAG: hypothetical protein ACREMR_03135 [Gemmatimonadales bacterium]